MNIDKTSKGCGEFKIYRVHNKIPFTYKSKCTKIGEMPLNIETHEEIGKISDTEGKPLYKIVGEIKTATARDFISLSTLQSEVTKNAKFNFSNPQIKMVFKYLGWTNSSTFQIDRPSENLINEEFKEFEVEKVIIIQ